MEKNYKLLLAIIFCFPFVGLSQSQFGPTEVLEGRFLGETIPLRDAEKVEEWTTIPENIRIINQKFSSYSPKAQVGALPHNGDEIVQKSAPFRDAKNLEQNFQGATVSQGQAIPPDPSGAVGPNHYVHAVNLVVKIFDKQGNLLAGPTFLGSFLGSGNNNGDPIVMYDQLADRFFVSQFRISDNALIVGVSSTPDPTGTFFVYEYPLSSFPDYPHYSVWPSGYYLTANKSGQTTYVLDRKAMLAGDSSPGLIGFGLPGGIRNPNTVFSPGAVNLQGTDFPENIPGYIVYLQDDSWSGGITTDHIKIWSIQPDFENPSNSTISAPQIIETQPFDSVFFPFGTGDIEQPGTTQRYDGQGGIISYMANYRSFSTHNSLLVNFNSDLGGNNPGIRWIELRNTDNGPFSIFQESTWDLADGENRFMGSMSMDEEGNIGLAYNVGSENTRAEIRYTGRMEGDPLGTMTFPETTIISSSGIQTTTNRFGDYAQMVIDMDNRTFWHTSQYFPGNNFWGTRIASFRFIADKTDDVGVYNFAAPNIFTGPYSSDENVTVSLYNFGTSAQSSFDIELYVDGNLVATETYSDTIEPESSDTYTFNQTIDLSNSGQEYEVEARTNLSGDEYADNDGFSAILTGGVLSIAERDFNEANLFIRNISGNTYEVNFTTSAVYDNLKLKVYNLLGQTASTAELKNVSGGYQATLDLSTMASGVYIAEISNGNSRISKRFIVE